MKYIFTPPRQERHEVIWCPDDFPGIYKKDKTKIFFCNTVLCDDLSEFLDEIAYDWMFKYEEDHGETYATLIVSSREIANKFIEKATELSLIWKNNDHEKKVWRVYNVVDDSEEEICREHDDQYYNIDTAIFQFLRERREIESIEKIRKIRSWIHSCRDMNEGESRFFEYHEKENLNVNSIRIYKVQR